MDKDTEISAPWKIDTQNILALKPYNLAFAPPLGSKDLRPGYNTVDKPLADFIQHYGLSATQCFLSDENPTFALMALMPFRLGDFCLAEEMFSLLFFKRDTQTALKNFEKHFDEILNSIANFHCHEENDPYIIQTAISLQMLVHAVLTRATILREEEKSKLLNRLLLKLDNLSIVSRTERVTTSRVGTAFSITVPAIKLLDPMRVFPTHLAPSLVKIYKSYSNDFVSQQQITQTFEYKPSADIFQNCHLFLKEDPFVELEEIVFLELVEEIKRAFWVAAEKEKINNCFEMYLSSQGDMHLKEILDVIKDKNAAPQQQAFALIVLNALIDKESHSIYLLFAQKKNKNFLNTLLTLEPKGPRCVLLQGVLFRNLATFFKADKNSLGLLATYLELYKKRSPFFIKKEKEKQLKAYQEEKTKTQWLFIIPASLIVSATFVAVFGIMSFPLLLLAGGLYGIGFVGLDIIYEKYKRIISKDLLRDNMDVDEGLKKEDVELNGILYGNAETVERNIKNLMVSHGVFEGSKLRTGENSFNSRQATLS